MRMLTLRFFAAMAMLLVGSETEICAMDSPPPQSAATPAARPGQADEPWVPLFNGRDLDGWYTFLQKHGKNSDPDRVITIEDGSIHLYKDAADGSHVGMGSIGTDKEFSDYHLRFQYRWG